MLIFLILILTFYTVKLFSASYFIIILLYSQVWVALLNRSVMDFLRRRNVCPPDEEKPESLIVRRIYILTKKTFQKFWLESSHDKGWLALFVDIHFVALELFWSHFLLFYFLLFYFFTFYRSKLFLWRIEEGKNLIDSCRNFESWLLLLLFRSFSFFLFLFFIRRDIHPSFSWVEVSEKGK